MEWEQRTIAIDKESKQRGRGTVEWGLQSRKGDCEPEIDGSRHRTVDLSFHLRGVKKGKRNKRTSVRICNKNRPKYLKN